MTERTYKVGDVVAWAEVPSGALARQHGGQLFVRRGLMGWWVSWLVIGWPWDPCARAHEVTIVALGITGQESAADLRRLAEVFEIREALLRGERAADEHSLTEPLALVWIAVARHFGCRVPGLGYVAERLHAAGWRPGMTAEDAARLLAEASVGSSP